MMMERTAWTDERLDDLAQRMDAGFARVDEDIRDLRAEMRSGFAEVHRRIDAQGVEFRAEVEALRQTMIRVGSTRWWVTARSYWSGIRWAG